MAQISHDDHRSDGGQVGVLTISEDPYATHDDESCHRVGILQVSTEPDVTHEDPDAIGGMGMMEVSGGMTVEKEAEAEVEIEACAENEAVVADDAPPECDDGEVAAEEPEAEPEESAVGKMTLIFGPFSYYNTHKHNTCSCIYIIASLCRRTLYLTGL